MVITFLYMNVSASTFTGLYRLVAQFQLHHFGSYREVGSFIAPLLLLWLPVRWISPEIWRRPTGRAPREVATSSTIEVAQSHAGTRPVARSQAQPRRWRPWKVALVVVGSLVMSLAIFFGIIFAIASKQSQEHHDPDITTIDLAKNQPLRPDAYLVVVVGEAQPRYMIPITRTLYGSETRKVFIPITGPG